MNWVTGILVFVIIWWLVLFVVLPIGIRQPDEVEPGHMAGAPERPRMWLRIGVTTAIAGVLWLGAYYLIISGFISFEGITR